MELIILQEPMVCPICKEANRAGFLRTIMDSDRGTKSGLSIQFECSTCKALFGVKQ